MPDTYDGTTIPSPAPVTLVGGTDGTLAQVLRLTSDGDIKIGAGSAAIGTVDTELPAAAAAADAFANPTTTNIMAMLMGFNGTTWDRVDVAGAGSDGASEAGQPLAVWGAERIYNGTTWDRERGNVPVTLLASAARTATTSSADQTNYNGRGVKLVFDITAVPGVETVTLTIQGKDDVSGKYYTILAGAAQTGTGTLVMTVYPGITASANLAVSDILPRTWRVTVTHSASGSFTYSVAASVIL